MDQQNFYAPPQASYEPGPSQPAGGGPVEFSETVVEIFRFAGRHYMALLPVGIVWGIANGGFGAMIDAQTEALIYGQFSAASFLVTYIGFLLAFVFTWCLGLQQVKQLHRGEGLTGSFSAAFTRMLPMAGFFFFYGLAFMGGAILCFLPGVFLFVALFLGDTAVVVEKKGPFEALQRSYDLVKDNWWYTFALLLVLWAAVVPIWVVSLLAEIFLAEMILAKAAITAVMTALFWPVTLSLTFVTYLSLVARNPSDYWQELDGTLQ